MLTPESMCFAGNLGSDCGVKSHGPYLDDFQGDLMKSPAHQNDCTDSKATLGLIFRVHEEPILIWQ